MTIIIVKAESMADNVRRKMVQGAIRLLATKGLQGASFSEILELTKAPRGSIYYHFPDGKQQLVCDAVDLAGAQTLQAMDDLRGSSAIVVTEKFLQLWRELLVRSNFKAGCSVLAVTVAADAPELLNHAAAVFTAWHQTLTKLLEAGGLSKKQSAEFATTLIAASEGAVVLSRAQRSLKPFDTVAKQLVGQIKELVA